MSMQFHNKGGEQNVGQGEGAIGKQVNDNRSTTQTIEGDGNTVAARDVHIKTEHHHHYSEPQTGPQTGSSPTPRLLPPQDHIFLHRETELDWLDQHLQPNQIVAICGPGGMGKSALAARAVRALPADRFPDGIIFHTFYHHAETAQALQTIAHALGLKAETNLEQQVASALSSKQALLILDGAEEAEDLPAVLRLRGSCGVLITTRRKSDCGPLRLDLPPLPDEQAQEVLRAWGEVRGDAATVQQICHKLGGWPVALRLAGHYLHSTGEPATDYLRWLEQEPLKELALNEAHQADNAALLLKRSVAQVSDDARFALRIIGTLASAPFTERPVVALLKLYNVNTWWGLCSELKAILTNLRAWLLRCSDEDIHFSRKVLSELVNFGLLNRSDDGWQVSHALIHAYVRTEQPLNRFLLKGLASFYIVFAQEQSAAGVSGYARLDKKRVHCLHLIQACLDRGLWKEVKVLGAAIWEYLDRQGWLIEQLAVQEMRLIAACKLKDRHDEAGRMNDLGYIYRQRGELIQALYWHEQCLSIRRELGDRQGEGVTLNNMGLVYSDLGNYEQALEVYQQSLSIRKETGYRQGEGTTLNNIGLLYDAQKDYERALQYYEHSLPIRQEVGDKLGEACTLNNIAAIYRDQATPYKALKYNEQALTIRREQGDRVREMESCCAIGSIYKDMGDLAKAEEYISQAVAIKEAIGTPDLEKCRNCLDQVRAKLLG